MMEGNNTVKTLLQYSQLNIKVPLKNLSTLLRKQLKDGFCHEDIPQYCDHIITIKELIAHYHGQPDIAELHEDILELLENVCLPLLHHIHPTIDNRKEVFQLLGCVGQLISTCTKIDNKLVRLVIESIDENLTVYIKEKPMFTDIGQHEHVCYDIHTMLEILRQVLIQGSKQKSFELDDTLKSDVASLFDKLIIVVELVTIEIVGSLCIPVMLKILQINKGKLDYFMRQIWQCILSTGKSDVADMRKQYMLLCGFANQFFPLDGTPNSLDLRTEEQLWLIVQAGLVSKDTINRKRSLYILKRVVDICETVGSELNVDKSQKYPMFWWSQDQGQKLSKVWESFMLLAEVFEDKQVHVIKPLLPRMKTLMTASELSDSQGPPLLHTSWLMTLFYRCSFHESLQIIRWASDYVLSMDLQRVPLFEQQQDQYLTGPLLDSLKESRLYVRDPSCPVGSMPLIADKLSQFYTNCCQSLPQHRRGEFLCQTIQHVCETTWSFVPLFFVVRSLSLVPASPCLDQATVNKLRKLLSGSLVTAESYLRGAIQCFLVQMVTNLTDKSKVELEDMLQLLSLLCREDSLQRGTTLWNQTVAWLKEESDGCLPSWTAELIKDSIEKKTAKYLETAIDAKLSNADTTSAGVIARLLLLASDASMITTADETGSSLLVRVLQTIGSVINAINTHAYMPQHKADKALLLLNHIVAEANPQKCASDVTVVKAVRATIGALQPELLLYLCRQTSQGIETMMDLPLLDLYLESLNTALVAMETVNLEEVGKFVDACCRVLLTEAPEEIPLDAKLSRFAAMCMLGSLAKFLSHDTSHGQSHDAFNRKYTCLIEKLLGFLKSWKIQVHFPRPAGDSSVSQKEWGKVTSCYLECQWQLVRLVLQSSPTSWAGERYLLDLAMETLAVGLEETVYPVIQSIGLLINKMLELGPSDDSYIVTVIEACWAPVIEARRAALFFNVLEAFVQTAFQQCLLCRAEESEVVECLRKYGSKLVQMGLERNGVANTLVEQLWLSWKHPAMVEHVHKYMNLLVQLCMFGDLPKRTDRLLFDVCAAIRGLGSACSVNDLRESLLNKDVEVRATAINILCLLDPAVAGHQVLATRLIAACVEEYTDILKSHPHITFSNSLYHRQRHRLMQVVLLLEHFTSDAYLGEMWKFVWSALEQESQPSIRHMLEWIAIANITSHETLLQDLWNLFAKFKETKNLVLLSLLTIVVHVGPHLKSSLQEGFLTKAIPAVLPWCMAHHFNTRIFAQAALVKLWDQCQNLGLSTIIQKHAVLQTIVDFHEGNRNSTKNVTKLLDSFFFKYLDTKRDFSIETLFYTLPKMTGLTEEEWMGPDLFLQSCHTWESCPPTSFIPLRNSYHHTCEIDIWRYRGGLKLADEEDGDEGGNGDVQKKIMPWRQMMVEDENQQEIDFGVKQGTRDGLVVVTSLIDKIPNLGGLCRTSEIFGVSEYVLGKLQYVEDKAFQSLSVTAHKWLPITEVYDTKLPEYLQQKRLEGYTLVGVEQTANSISLTDFVFPEKTLLLLGNEKEGIPVDLISLLDVCVEIPQQGVVRSLNVHVSGALLIWEYRRQQLVKDRAQKMSE